VISRRNAALAKGSPHLYALDKHDDDSAVVADFTRNLAMPGDCFQLGRRGDRNRVRRRDRAANFLKVFYDSHDGGKARDYIIETGKKLVPFTRLTWFVRHDGKGGLLNGIQQSFFLPDKG
jgi:hypothetical protein